MWPSEAASIRAVRPCFSLTLMSASCFSSSSTTWSRMGGKCYGQKKEAEQVHWRTSGGSDRTPPHLRVPVFGGAQQRGHPPAVGYLQPRPPLQEERAHLRPPSSRCRAQHWQRVGIETRRGWICNWHISQRGRSRGGGERRERARERVGYFHNVDVLFQYKSTVTSTRDRNCWKRYTLSCSSSSKANNVSNSNSTHWITWPFLSSQCYSDKRWVCFMFLYPESFRKWAAEDRSTVLMTSSNLQVPWINDTVYHVTTCFSEQIDCLLRELKISYRHRWDK